MQLIHVELLLSTEDACINFCSTVKPSEDGKSNQWMVKKGISYFLITITGGVALSVVDDLSIYYACIRLADTGFLTAPGVVIMFHIVFTLAESNIYLVLAYLHETCLLFI